MNIINIESDLQANTYPGRGIIIGHSPNGKKAFVVYFIMGRSENSRNRIFSETEDGIRTEAFEPAKMVDPSLIIYHPVRFYDGHIIVTNGDQTDTIRDHMKNGHCFRHALATREFEPDSPNFTPRISGIVAPDGSYKLSILKSAQGNPACCCRYYFEYDKPIAGQGHFIHTYKCDGNPIPSYEGEPKVISISDDITNFANKVWNALNNDNKVSLYACAMDIETGKSESLIINKYVK
jgi:IMP cyclohydrolase